MIPRHISTGFHGCWIGAERIANVKAMSEAPLCLGSEGTMNGGTLSAEQEIAIGVEAVKRLDALIDGHELGMKRLLQRLDEPKRAIDLFTALFARAIEKDSLGMATGETIAHLNCLKGRGLVTSVHEGGTTLYRRAT